MRLSLLVDQCHLIYVKDYLLDIIEIHSSSKGGILSRRGFSTRHLVFSCVWLLCCLLLLSWLVCFICLHGYMLML